MATVVAFHAHPDDEVLLTGGTLARPGALSRPAAPATGPAQGTVRR